MGSVLERTLAALAAVMALSAAACEERPAPAASEPVSMAPARPEPLGTTLVAVTLTPEGRAAIDSAVSRSFSYRGPLREWEELRAEVARTPAAPGLTRLPAPPPTVRSPSGGASVELIAPRGEALAAAFEEPQSYALVVSAPALASPVAVPLGLTPPRAVAGDVVDAWHSGSVILRAPHFGPGTRVAMFALTSRGATPLSEAAVEVRP